MGTVAFSGVPELPVELPREPRPPVPPSLRGKLCPALRTSDATSDCSSGLEALAVPGQRQLARGEVLQVGRKDYG